MAKHEKTVIKHKKRNRKNAMLRRIIAIELELIFCICLTWGIFNIHEGRFLDKVIRSANMNIVCADLFVAMPASTLPTVSAVKEGLEEELSTWKGPVLSKIKGVNQGPSGKETYYNLNMSGVVNIMRRMGNDDEYWVRDDGVKMLGDYIMVAANLNLRPRGSLVETSLGTAIVCDTGGFASGNPTQIDIATTW